MRLLLALAFVATLLFIGYSLSPDSGSAQETSGEEATPTPSAEATGKLMASRTTLGLGETIEVTAYDLVPADTRAKFVVSTVLSDMAPVRPLKTPACSRFRCCSSLQSP